MRKLFLFMIAVLIAVVAMAARTRQEPNLVPCEAHPAGSEVGYGTISEPT